MIECLLLTEEYRHVVAARVVKLSFLGPELPVLSAEEGRQGEVGIGKWENGEPVISSLQAMRNGTQVDTEGQAKETQLNVFWEIFWYD